MDAMRPLDDLIDRENSAIGVVMDRVSNAQVKCEIFPPAADREEALLRTQVTIRSPTGALVYMKMQMLQQMTE
jgi:hypothetical protein